MPNPSLSTPTVEESMVSHHSVLAPCLFLVRIVLLLLLLLAFGLSCGSLADCNFILFGTTETLTRAYNDDQVRTVLDETKVGFGMFRWGVDVTQDFLDAGGELLGFSLSGYDDDYYFYNDDRRYDDRRYDDDWYPFEKYTNNNFLRRIDWRDLAVGKVCLGYPAAKKDVDSFEGGSKSFDVLARAFGVVGASMGGISFLGMGATTFFIAKRIQTIWWICRGALLLAVLGQALTFLLFGSTFCTEGDFERTLTCKVGPGAIMSILSLFFYVVAFVLSCFILAPNRSMFVINPLLDSPDGEKSSLIQKDGKLKEDLTMTAQAEPTEEQRFVKAHHDSAVLFDA